MKLSTLKESPSSTSRTSYPTTEPRKRSSQIGTHVSHHASVRHFVSASTSDKTSAPLITHKQMAPASARTSHSNSTSGSTAARSRTVGTLGCHSNNIRRTHGHPPPRRNHLSTYS